MACREYRNPQSRCQTAKSSGSRKPDPKFVHITGEGAPAYEQPLTILERCRSLHEWIWPKFRYERRVHTRVAENLVEKCPSA